MNSKTTFEKEEQDQGSKFVCNNFWISTVQRKLQAYKLCMRSLRLTSLEINRYLDLELHCFSMAVKFLSFDGHVFF